jgi:hypothetical protein
LATSSLDHAGSQGLFLDFQLKSSPAMVRIAASSQRRRRLRAPGSARHDNPLRSSWSKASMVTAAVGYGRARSALMRPLSRDTRSLAVVMVRIRYGLVIGASVCSGLVFVGFGAGVAHPRAVHRESVCVAAVHSPSPGVASAGGSDCWAHRPSPSSHSAGLRVFAERDGG